MTSRLGQPRRAGASTSAIACCSTGDREYNYEPIRRSRPAARSTAARSPRCGGRAYDDDLHRVVQRQGRLDASHLRDARADRAADHHPRTAPTPSGAHAAGHRPHPRGRQPAVRTTTSRRRRSIAARRSHLLQGRLASATTSSRPASSTRRAAPTTRTPHYVNDGFVLEEHRLRDVNNIAGRARFRSAAAIRRPVDLRTRQAEDRDFRHLRAGLVAAAHRLTLNVGVRADFVKRNDKLFDIVRQNSVDIGPRFGFSYMLTSDARTCCAAAPCGPRADDGPRRHHAVRRQRGRRRHQHLRPDGNGVFEASEPCTTPARAASIADYEIRRRSAPALRRRVHPRPAPAVPVAAEHRRRRHPPQLQGHLGAASTSTASTRRDRTSRSAASAPSTPTAASSSSSRTTRGAR